MKINFIFNAGQSKRLPYSDTIIVDWNLPYLFSVGERICLSGFIDDDTKKILENISEFEFFEGFKKFGKFEFEKETSMFTHLNEHYIVVLEKDWLFDALIVLVDSDVFVD